MGQEEESRTGVREEKPQNGMGHVKLNNKESTGKAYEE